MVQDQVGQHKLYAALAQLDSFPAASPHVMRTRADILRRLGMTQEATKYYVTLRSTCLVGDADHGLGLIAAAQGDYVGAVKFLKAAAQARPTEYQTRNDLGMAYMYTGYDDNAHFELMTALELDSGTDQLPALNLLSLSLVEGDANAVNQVVNRFDFSGDQLAEAIHRCNDVVYVRKAYAKVAKRLATAPTDPPPLENPYQDSCQWGLLEQSPKLSSIIKEPKMVKQ